VLLKLGCEMDNTSCFVLLAMFGRICTVQERLAALSVIRSLRDHQDKIRRQYQVQVCARVCVLAASAVEDDAPAVLRRDATAAVLSQDL
jgi:hypothetical protein